jgi:hypothetical protein
MTNEMPALSGRDVIDTPPPIARRRAGRHHLHQITILPGTCIM